MSIVPPEILAPVAFLVGLAMGAVASWCAGRRRGYEDGLEDGRSGK